MRHIQQHIDKVTQGEINRLMLFVPPRHGKSEMVTVRYPVWRLERDPSLRVIIGAYNQILANKFSRKARRIAEGRMALAPDRQAVEDWETTEGGGFRAIGVGAGITGQGGQLVIIDDPVKSREEANSQAYRERVWDWYRDDLYTRLEPGGQVILIQTRWHEDDLAGRILASEDAPNWTVVSLPALAEEGDPLDRKVGQALCPERYNEAALAQIKRVLGTLSFEALYQQKPMPAEGAVAKREWFSVVDAAPVGSRVRFYDLAATEKSTKNADPDYSVGTLMVEREGIYYVSHVIRERTSAVMELLANTAQVDGKSAAIVFEQEPGAGGKLLAGAIVKKLAGFNVRAVPSSGDKLTRALPFLAQAEAGNVRLVRGPWNAAWLDEVCAFPYAAHDDQWDSVAGAFSALTSTLNYAKPGAAAYA